MAASYRHDPCFCRYLRNRAHLLHRKWIRFDFGNSIDRRYSVRVGFDFGDCICLLARPHHRDWDIVGDRFGLAWVFFALRGNLSHVCLRFRDCTHHGNSPGDWNIPGFRNIYFLLDHNRHWHFHWKPFGRSDILLLRDFDRYGNFDREPLSLGENLRFCLDAGFDYRSSEIIRDGAYFRLWTGIFCASNRMGLDFRFRRRICASDRERFRNRNGDCFCDRVWFRNSKGDLLGNKIGLFNNAWIDPCMRKDFSGRFPGTRFRQTSHPFRHSFVFRNSTFHWNLDRDRFDDGLNDRDRGRYRNLLNTRPCNRFNKCFGNRFRTAILP